MGFSRGDGPSDKAIERALRWHSQALTDASEQAELQSWLPIEIQQLSAGSYAGSYTELGLSDLRLVSEYQSQTAHKRGILAENRCTVSFVRTTNPNNRFNHYKENSVPPVFFLPADTEFDVQVAGDTQSSYIDFDQEELLEAASIIAPANWERTPAGLTVFNTPGYRDLLNTVELLEWLVPQQLKGGLPMDVDYMRRLLLDSAVVAIGEATILDNGNGVEYHARRRALSLVRQTREYIDAELARVYCPTVVDICCHTQVSQRTLQYAFRELLDMTPVAYLRIVRLNRARVELLAPPSPATTVTEVASRWGFLHFSKFSRDFSVMFGEFPSETLRRSLS